MIDEEKLETYVETINDNDYRIRCDSGEDFFQVAVQHLEEDPQVEELFEKLFETVALRGGHWIKETDTNKDHSFLYVWEEPKTKYWV